MGATLVLGVTFRMKASHVLEATLICVAIPEVRVAGWPQRGGPAGRTGGATSRTKGRGPPDRGQGPDRIFLMKLAPPAGRVLGNVV